MRILTLNCWSHSIAYNLVDWEKKSNLASGTVERVTLGAGSLTCRLPGREPVRRSFDCPDHRTAVASILDIIADPECGAHVSREPIAAVAHRVVHGGEQYRKSVAIDDDVLAVLRDFVPYAPLHNANNIAGIEAGLALLPQIPHIAVFDTAFHQTMPEEAYIYPLPYAWYTHYGVRRYGFHGPSHLYAARRAAALLGKPLEECSLVTVTSGKGVSLCAIRNGCSVDTSMGLTPTEGAAMETRCGDIDPGIPAFIMQGEDLSPREIDAILNHKSGISGIAGGDRVSIAERARNGEPRARLALDVEAYRLRKYIGAYIAAIGRTDAVVFASDAPSSDWEMRGKVLTGMAVFGLLLDEERNRMTTAGEEAVISRADSPVKAFVVPTREEMIFCEEVAGVLAGG
ncbi:MAG TPA: acetate/propionate family kinase [Geobacteraceae bacterium]